MNDGRVRGLVADDERIFREALVEALAKAWPSLALIGVCEDGNSALEALIEHEPDVAFLDVRMPGLSGLDVAEICAAKKLRTHIVMVTAYDQYAIEAFERGAIDYLLKPVADERLAICVDRLKRFTEHPPLERASSSETSAFETVARNLEALGGEALNKPLEPLHWITASNGRETRLIAIDDVVYFQSDHKYTHVVTEHSQSLLRTPISELSARLDPAKFRRIHRSTAVNLSAVASIVREPSGRGILRLKNRPETLVVSAAYMLLFKNM